MDSHTQAAVESFFRAAPLGQVDISMAGDSATHRIPANLAEVNSHVAWNMPGPAIQMSNVLDMDGGIDLSSISKGLDSLSGPQVGGVNHVAALRNKPTGPS